MVITQILGQLQLEWENIMQFKTCREVRLDIAIQVAIKELNYINWFEDKDTLARRMKKIRKQLQKAAKDE